jgi:hypothetical protein
VTTNCPVVIQASTIVIFSVTYSMVTSLAMSTKLHNWAESTTVDIFCENVNDYVIMVTTA